MFFVPTEASADQSDLKLFQSAVPSGLAVCYPDVNVARSKFGELVGYHVHQMSTPLGDI